MKTNVINILLVIALISLAGFGCKTMTEGKPAAEKGVTQFHEMLAEEKYSEIYSGSSDLMKGAATEADMLKLFRHVNAKLGKVVSTKTESWKIENYNLTSTVTLVQATQFERGKGTEQFVFEVSGKEARLAGYHINSMDLLSE